jgi:alpha-beta hydrolase superfamily lysophospholipase
MKSLITIVVIAALAWFGAAFYFSEEIRTEIIELQPYEPYQLSTVVGTEFKEITLENSDTGETKLYRGELAGVEWDGGYGQITDFLGSGGNTVRRTFKVLEGDEPPGGTLVVIDEYYWPNDPSVLGLDYLEYDVEGPLGPLPVWEFPVEDEDAFLNEAGFNALIMSYRNDAGAPEVEDRQVEFGLTEWEDLKAVVDHVVEEHGTDVTVMGQSMGGAITLSWMINDPITANQIRAVVLDSPSVDISEVVRFGASKLSYEWREFEFFVPSAFVETTLFVSRLRHSFDWGAMDYVERANDLPDTPILVLHGTRDDSVPIGPTREFASEARTARLIEYPAGGHTRLWNVDPDRYRDDVIEFLDLQAP